MTILALTPHVFAERDVLILDDAYSKRSFALKKRLEKIIPKDASVKIVTTKNIKETDWARKTYTLIVAHAPTSDLERNLGEEGLRSIEDFVKNQSGNYIGLFGGAFLAAQDTLYKNKDKTDNRKNRLGLAPLRASGPIQDIPSPNITYPALDLLNDTPSVEQESASIQYNRACGHHTHEKSEEFPWCATFKGKEAHMVCLYIPRHNPTHGKVLLSQIALDKADDSLFLALLRRFSLFPAQNG